MPQPEPETTAAICETILSFILATPPPPGSGAAAKSFSQLEVDSVSIYQLQMQIEERYGLELEDSFLFEYPTPERAAAAIAGRLGQVSSAQSG